MSETDKSSAPIRILIVDDHLVVRAGLHMLIENHPGMTVVAMASNRAEAMELAARDSQNLIFWNWTCEVKALSTFLTQLPETTPNAQILVLTGLRDTDAHRQAVQLGAMGVVLKEHAPDVLIKAIEKVHAGEIWLDRPTMGRMLREMSGRDEKEVDPELTRIESLTQREREVVALIAEGLNRQIGERSFISETTVTHHLSSIYSKLGVSDRLELVIYAFTHKIKPDLKTCPQNCPSYCFCYSASLLSTHRTRKRRMNQPTKDQPSSWPVVTKCWSTTSSSATVVTGTGSATSQLLSIALASCGSSFRSLKTKPLRQSKKNPGKWRSAEAGKVKTFFLTKFNKPLPLSAFGQSDLHTRWGLDHRNSMDVNLHPDSVEGRALIAYLRAEAIPFLVFRAPIPGVATGPHIHVGYRSSRSYRR